MQRVSVRSPGVRSWEGNTLHVALHPSRSWIARSTRTHVEVMDITNEVLLASWPTQQGTDPRLFWVNDRLLVKTFREGQSVVTSHRLPDGEVVAQTSWNEPNGCFAMQQSADHRVLFVPGKDDSSTSCVRGTWLDADTLERLQEQSFFENTVSDWNVRPLQLGGLHPEGRFVTLVEESLETNAWRLGHHGKATTHTSEEPNLRNLQWSPPCYDTFVRVQWLNTRAVLLLFDHEDRSTVVQTIVCFAVHGAEWRAYEIRDALRGDVFRWAASRDGTRIAVAYFTEEKDVYLLSVHSTRDGGVLAERSWQAEWGSLWELSWDTQERVVAITRASEPEEHRIVRWSWSNDTVTLQSFPMRDSDDTLFPIGTLGEVLVFIEDSSGILLCE